MVMFVWCVLVSRLYIVCVCVCVCVCMVIYIYIYTCIYMHVHVCRLHGHEQHLVHLLGVITPKSNANASTYNSNLVPRAPLTLE